MKTFKFINFAENLVFPRRPMSRPMRVQCASNARPMRVQCVTNGFGQETRSSSISGQFPCFSASTQRLAPAPACRSPTIKMKFDGAQKAAEHLVVAPALPWPRWQQVGNMQLPYQHVQKQNPARADRCSLGGTQRPNHSAKIAVPHGGVS